MRIPAFVLLAALLVGARPVATAQNTTVLSVGGDKVTILRDRYGVPHVFASTARGLFYGNGYAVAEDRLGQMELYRRTAKGEMAELVGPSAVSADKETRLDGYTESEREAQFERLAPELQTVLTAYAEGVNAYLANLRSKLGEIEIKVANFPGKLDIDHLQPWKVTDTIAIGQMMGRRFGGGEGGELRNMLLFGFLKTKYKNDAIKLLNDVAWRNDPLSPPTIPAAEDPAARTFKLHTHWGVTSPLSFVQGEGPGVRSPSSPLLLSTRLPGGEVANAVIPSLQGVWTGGGRRSAASTSPPNPKSKIQNPKSSFDPSIALAAADILDQKARLDLANRLGLMTKWGSYCFVVSKGKSATGNAMLVGGPQMGFRTPQIAHEIHISGAGIDAIGMGFAGVPGVLIGHNKNLAWSTTTGVNDETDIFVETLDPNDPTRYKFKGEWRTMEKRTETIAVAGGDPVSLDVFRTVHGPVVQVDAAHHLAYSRATTYWQHELDTIGAIYRFQSARNVKEFGAACALITTSHNFLCATQDGDIGYWFCGRTPIRAPGIDPRFPTPGDGTKEWRGTLQFDRQPHMVNPKQGYLANWNNKPAVWWDNYDTPVWGEVFHNGRIAQLLAAKPKLAPEDLRNILLDIGTNDYTAQVLLPMLNAAAAAHPALLTRSARTATGYLAAWDHHATEGSVAKTIFDAWLDQVREDLFGKPFGFIKFTGADLFKLAMQPSLVAHVLRGKASAVPLQWNYLGGRTPDRAMLDALNAAVAKLEKQHGDSMPDWRFTRGQIDFKPLGPIPSTDRGTYIQIVECSKPLVRGVNILPPGQSERTDSPHIGDQRDLAAAFFFKPMLTTREEIEKSVGP